jgi:hypothetical protein
MFPTFGFLTRKILRIISSQIEIEKKKIPMLKFSQIWKESIVDNYIILLDILIFVNNNWPNDAKVGCNVHNYFVEFIYFELDEFESIWTKWIERDLIYLFCLICIQNVITYFCLYIRVL